MVMQLFGIIDFSHWRWLFPWLFALSIIVFIGSIIAVWIVQVRLPEDYLTRDRSKEVNLSRSKMGHLANMIVRNVAGLGFLLLM